MLHDALRYIRLANGISLSALADELGLSKSYMSEIENRKKVPSLEVVTRYAEYFEMPISSIMFFSEELEHGEGKVSHAVRRVLSRNIIHVMDFAFRHTNDAADQN